jgi:DNA-binding MarR family transcriptional regulator
VAGDWTFLTNHGHVLVCLAQDPDARVRDVADRVGITERAVRAIVADLVEGGYVRVTKVGRRNRYRVLRRPRLRHPVEAKRSVGALLDLFPG